jgi:VCBS repeat-containing protein
MTRTRGILTALFFVFLFVVPAQAATTDFRVLFDSDNNAATGCIVAGMPGVDLVFRTQVTTNETSGSVTRTSRQVCVVGFLGAETNVDTTSWPTTFNPASGSLGVETMIPFDAFGSGTPDEMRIGIQATSGAAVHTAVLRPDGSPALFPGVRGKRRSAGAPGAPRVITLDGNDADWFGISPFLNGIASGGTAGLRIIKVSAFSDVVTDRLYFLFDANISTDAPFASDDDYVREAGSDLTVLAPGVLANDGDPNGLPITALPVTPAEHGDVTLNPDGSFTYTPDDPDSTSEDEFEYKATNGSKDSNAARVRISVNGDGNDSPVFTSAGAVSVVENTTSVVALAATDAEGDTVTFSITGGADAGDFTITSGTLRFSSAPDFEDPDDSDNDNVYAVQVTADDGNGGTTVQSILVTVTNENEEPEFTSSNSVTVAENENEVLTVTVDDPDGDTIEFDLVAGGDSGDFAIHSGTGELTFSPAAPNFEAPADANADNVYTVTVSANDGANTITQTITVTVTNVNEGPSFTSGTAVTIAENTTAVTTVTTTDPEGDAITFSITGGADAALFGINASTGALAFLSAPNFEAPADADANNVYLVQVRANDGTNNTNQTIAVSISDVNEAPVFTFASEGLSVAENTTAVATVTAADQDAGAVITFSITGGADAGDFTINATTGALSFVTAPDFEAPADADANNVYLLQVTASDGTNAVNLVLDVTVTDANDAPAITSANNASVAENSTAVLTVTTTDQDADAITYSITGGADAGDFSINATTGALIFNAAPDFESPADADTDNVYLVQVTANDGTNNAVQTITVTVTDVNEAAVFTSGTSASVAENTLAVLTVVAADPEGGAVTYSITGGADAADFSINSSTGALVFASAPNFEAPADADANNQYLVEVTANDGTNNTVQTITVTVTNANDAPVITSTATTTAAENQTAAHVITSTDEDGNAVTYSITGGADAAFFSINATTGALTFNAAPNFEAPADAGANNVYDVQVTATDGTASVNQLVSVTVTNVDEAPLFTSSNSNSIAENTTAAHTVVAVDPEAGAIAYTVTGGADMALFSINATTGALTFNAAPDFEAPADADANNTYVVQVTAFDGVLNTSQTITITVTNANEAPSITSTNTNTIPENTLTAHTITATDPEADGLTFAINGGADAADFSIDSSTGVLTFLAAPDFENPADADTDNQYVVTVEVTDGTNTTSQTVAITVSDVNEAPEFTSGAAFNVAEGNTAVTTVTTTDQEGDTVTYSITGGADAADFSVDPNTGALTFNVAPDFEAPADADTNNTYVVEVTANDGTNTTPLTITVTVTDSNEAPAITSSNTASVAENSTAVLTAAATDQEGNTITWSISGGADAADFTINSSTGALSFVSAPDFEAPADANVDNQYIVEITANDGTNSTAQTVTVTVTDVNEAPSITSSNTASVAENTTAVLTATSTDPEGNTVTWSIVGGADSGDFSIDTNTGALTFTSAPDFEAPADADTNNQYVVTIRANDGTNDTDQTITVTVTDANEAPSITSANSASTAENTTAVIDVDATDVDAGATLTYSISGGADAGSFAINTSTGVLTFLSAPNFEAPADADTNNQYLVEVTVSDGSLTDVQTITVTVTDANEAPSITTGATASVVENTTAVTDVDANDVDAGATLTYSISGGADQALFGIVAGTGVLTFNAAPDFENPADADNNNEYIVEVSVSDGSLTDVQTITVTVTNDNEAPSITTAATASVAENTTAVTDVDATDMDAGATLTYSISGGADQALFGIVAGTGVLTFNSGRDFESPTDADTNNEYIVEVTVSDGTLTDVQTITVTVTDANEAPSITTGNTASTAENTTAVADVDATDVDAGATLTYSISGGADQALFGIVAGTGVLTFNAAPDFENPADADNNNQYIVEVTVSDGSLTDVETITVTVTDANEAPSFTSSATPSAVENQTTAVDVNATDPDAGATLSYSISGGADQALFSIDTNTGVLTFNPAPDFENPADADTDNNYQVEVTVTDGTFPVMQAITVSVTSENEAPSITSANTASVAENTVMAIDVNATDPDAGTTLTFSISGGADMGDFTIDGNTGVLSFNPAPDFEAPADADNNNEYIVEVTVSDGTLTDVQTITVTVTAVNEAPSFTSPNTADVPENTTAVHTVTTTDPELDSVLYSVSGGADMLKFTIDPNTGALAFASAPDFETPLDADNDNVYVVEVTANDGTNNATQSISVTVQNGNELPTFTSTATPSVPENQTAVVTVTTNDVDGDTVTYSITGGADAADFTIDTNTGALSFLVAPNFEAPHDADTNNVYLVDVTADDGPNTVVQNLTVTVNGVDEAPVFTSGATYSQDENISAVTTVTAVDPESLAVTYSITGGADAGDFSIDTNTGALSFSTPPDFDLPADADTDNEYLVEVTATDGVNPVVQSITVDITNVEEAPFVTSTDTPSVPENTTTAVDVNGTDPEGEVVTYALSGGADAADFTIDTNTGVLSFLVAPNFEAPHDADTNNIYLVDVEVDDGALSFIQSLTVTVTNVDEAPSITSANTANAAENQTAVIDVDATDPDAGAVLTYSIVGGADQLKFSIVNGTGVLTFQSAPDFETPTDAGANNVYDVDVQVSDGTNPVTQSIAVTVTNVDEAPSFSSAAAASVAENQTGAIDVNATDPEGVAVTYSISGGADQALFSIDTNTGVLTFLSAPNFESPADAGANNVYDVQVTASAGVTPGTQNIAITVTNVNEAPVNAMPGAQTTLEDTNRVFSSGNGNQISISDPDGDVNVQVTLSASNGTLSLSGVLGLVFTTGDGTADTTMTFTGKVSDINLRLNGLIFDPNDNYYSGSPTTDAISITTNDQGNTGSGGAQQDADTVAIDVDPVNDAPTTPSYTVALGTAHVTHAGLGVTISAADTNELKEDSADVDDHDPYSELTVQIVAGSVSPANATVSLIDASTGAFYFEPPGGLTGSGAASFQYRVCDNGDVGLSLAAQCSAAATVQFTITGTDTWYVDDTDAAGCGITCNGARTKPLVGLNAATLATRGTGDRIFAFSGTYNHGLTMAASELLVGQASSGAFDTHFGVVVPGNGTLDSRPSLSGAAVTLQNTLTAANNTVVRGITLTTGANRGYLSTGNTTLTVLESSVNSTGNMAIDVTGATNAATSVAFSSTTSGGGTRGVSLDGVNGTWSLGSGALNGHSQAAFYLQNSNAAQISYSGSFAPGAGRAVLIGTNNGTTVNASNGLESGTVVTLSGNMTGGGIGVYESTGGTLNLPGNLTFSTTTNNAVELVDNHNGTGGATINFSGGNLAITTTTGKGFHASLGGTINVTGANNTIVSGNGLGSGSTGGVALEVAGTAAELIPATTNYSQGGTYTFKSISAAFGVKGVSVNVHQGPLTVAGTGGAGTGGTINTMTNRGYELINVRGAVALTSVNVTNAGTANGSAAATCGEPVAGDSSGCAAGIHADTLPTSFALNAITVSGTSTNQMGINTRSVNNLTMANIEVANAGDESQESGVQLVNTTGSGSITNANFHDNETRQLYMYNNTGTLSSFTITGSTFSNSVFPNGQQGVLVESGNSAVMNVTVGGLAAGQGVTLSNLRGNAWQTAANDTSTLTSNLLGASVTNTNGIVGHAAGGNLNTTIQGSTFIAGANTTAGVISLKTDGGGDMNANVISNTIGNGTANSGTDCDSCNGMFINPRFGGSSTFTIRGNIIQNVDGRGILLHPGESDSQNVTAFITGNVIRDPGTFAAANRLAVEVQNGVTSGPPADAGCLAVTFGGTTNYGGASTNTDAMNIIEDAWNTAGSGAEVFFWQRFSTVIRMPGYAAPFDTYVKARNSITGATPLASGLGTISAGTSCP